MHQMRYYYWQILNGGGFLDTTNSSIRTILAIQIMTIPLNIEAWLIHLVVMGAMTFSYYRLISHN